MEIWRSSDKNSFAQFFLRHGVWCRFETCIAYRHSIIIANTIISQQISFPTLFSLLTVNFIPQKLRFFHFTIILSILLGVVYSISTWLSTPLIIHASILLDRLSIWFVSHAWQTLLHSSPIFHVVYSALSVHIKVAISYTSFYTLYYRSHSSCFLIVTQSSLVCWRHPAVHFLPAWQLLLSVSLLTAWVSSNILS